MEYLTHHLTVRTKTGNEYKVTILENCKTVMSSCSCNGTQKCIHVVNCLSGNAAFISPDFVTVQQMLFERLSSTKEGNETIKSALKRVEEFDKEELPFRKFYKNFIKKRI